MVSCSVRECDVTKRNNPHKYTFHRIPTNSSLRAKWIRFIDRGSWIPYKDSAICSKHFESKCIIQRKHRRVLMKDSIPTIYYVPLPKDMENYMQYNIMGTINQIRMNPDSLPSKFECQIADQPRDITLSNVKDKLNVTSKQRPPRRQGRTAKCKKAKVPSKAKGSKEKKERNDSDSQETNETKPPAGLKEAEWLDRPNVCRGCLAREASWDLTSSYMSSDGEIQLYLDMMMECLGIKMSNMSEFGPSKVICDRCAASLRGAHEFKRQVLRSEQRFAAHLRQKDGADVEIKSEILEPLALVDIFETHEMRNDVEIKVENIEEDSTVVTYDADNLETVFVSTGHGQSSGLEDLKNVDTSHTAGCSSTTMQVFHHTMDKKKSIEAPYHTIDHSYTKLNSKSTTEGYTESENVIVTRKHKQPRPVVKPSKKRTKKMCPIDISLKRRKNKTKEITPGGVNTLNFNRQTVRVTSGASYMDPILDSPMNSEDVSNEKVGNQCFSNKKSNVDYASDTPLSEMCGNADETESNEAKEGTCSDGHGLSPKAVCKAPQYTAPHVKQVSERRRIKQTCDTVLKDTTACPFRHHKSWFQCFYCPLDFMAIDMLRKHTALNHNSEELVQLKRYPRSLQIDITELKCNICNVDLTDVKDMVQHFLEVHQKVVYMECIADYKVNSSPFSCHLCCKQYHVFRTLTTHLNEHYANCICDVCGKSFLNTKRLKVHKRTHESGHFPCSECGKILKTKTSKANHMETHSKRILKCHICLQPMKHYNDRIKHMSEAHNITYKFKCPICGREFNIKHYLATHMRQTHGHKNKKCSECSMAFITNYGLKKHMLKHTGVKAFPCTFCSKSYARSYTLKEHLRCHEGEVKFVGE